MTEPFDEIVRFFYHGLYKRCAVLLQVASDCCTNEEIMQKITAI